MRVRALQFVGLRDGAGRGFSESESFRNLRSATRPGGKRYPDERKIGALLNLPNRHLVVAQEICGTVATPLADPPPNGADRVASLSLASKQPSSPRPKPTDEPEAGQQQHVEERIEHKMVSWHIARIC